MTAEMPLAPAYISYFDVFQATLTSSTWSPA